jgi:hypothetical protein
MKTPSFSAELSLREASMRHEGASEHLLRDDSATVVAAQACCGSRSGPCTSFGGGASITTFAGFTKACFGAFSYPWISACRDVNSGALTAVSTGCGFCLF